MDLFTTYDYINIVLFTIYLTVILSYLNFYYYYLIKLSTKLMEQSTLNFKKIKEICNN